MSINEFYQLFVGTFALLATIFLFMVIIFVFWSTIKIKEIIKSITSFARKIDDSADEIQEFVKRNIDYIEYQKAKLESFGWLKTFLSLIVHKKRGVQDAEDN